MQHDFRSFRGMQSMNLRCAIAHRGISSFRVRASAPRNDVFKPLNLSAPCLDSIVRFCGNRRANTLMKIALLVVLGLVLGALGGAALGIGAGLAWVEIFKTTSFEGYSGMLVFFTFMPVGAAIGGIAGALLFGVIGIRDDAIAIEREPVARRDR